jgi:hypothetical protein
MSGAFTIEVLGAEVLANRFKAETRAFQAEQKKQMRVAAKLVKTDVVHKTQSLFASRGPHKGAGGQVLGPLDRNIGVRVFSTTLDVIAFIRPAAKAFYGRFLETGLDVIRKGRITGSFRSAFGRKKSVRSEGHSFRLKREPFLEPVAIADAQKVEDILGSSYDVFYRGGA